jgi:cytochrome P450/NADPH-cytochrome P450 reductase
MTISGAVQTTLPTNMPVPAYDVLSAYVELAQPATKRNILTLVEAAQDQETKENLQHLATEGYTSDIGDRKVSILDLLEKYPSIDLPFGTFLSLLPPMRVRR